VLNPGNEPIDGIKLQETPHQNKAVYPDNSDLTWVNRLGESRIKRLNALHKNEEEYKAFQARVDKLYEEKLMEFPNVLVTPEVARELYAQYLQDIPDIKLLSIAIPDNYVTKEIEGEFIKLAGAYSMVKKNKELEPDAIFRGFDILVHDYSSFDSFLCTGLHKVYYHQLGIRFNQNGLIDNYQEALRAAKYTMDNRLGEPWHHCPWLISEYPLS